VATSCTRRNPKKNQRKQRTINIFIFDHQTANIIFARKRIFHSRSSAKQSRRKAAAGGGVDS
jgi:hypothetical protein